MDIKEKDHSTDITPEEQQVEQPTEPSQPVKEHYHGEFLG